MEVFAYYDVETNGVVYYVPPDNQQENQFPSTLGSESESDATASTIQSDEVPGFFVLHHGRQYPVSENTPRWFPSDNIRRYVIRYIVNNWVFGGNYAGPVEKILAPVEERTQCALELGTRTGTWIQAVATDFPHVQFLSLDLVPTIAHAPRSNIVFEVYDFTTGLVLEDGSQDVVFLNNMIELVRDYRALLREVHRVLRPGGLIHISDYSIHMWNPVNLTPLAPRTNPKASELLERVRGFISGMGVDPDTCDRLPEWLQPDSSLWDSTAGQKGFEKIQSVMRTHPLHPHRGYSCMDGLGTSMASLMTHLNLMSLRDMIGFLKASGMDEQEAERLIEDVIGEMKQPAKCVLAKVYYIYATKI